MAITPTLIKQWWDGKKLWVELSLAFSGSYVSGGDTVNLQTLGIQSTGNPTVMDVKSTSGVAAQTLNSYIWVKGTSLANGLIRCFVGTAEVSAGAYPAAVSGDTAVALFQIKGFR